jgi:acylphosphatase
MLRYTITFTGNVQGVGFRYTTVNISAGFNVSGWVRNDQDGTVQCVAEGDKTELDRFVKAIKDAMHGHIENATIQTGPATNEFEGFHIRR